MSSDVAAGYREAGSFTRSVSERFRRLFFPTGVSKTIAAAVSHQGHSSRQRGLGNPSRTLLAQLFFARVRQQLTPSDDVLSGELLTREQVRRAANVVVSSLPYPPRIRRQLYEEESARQKYHARRNAQASRSHRRTRRQRLAELRINPDKIKSVPLS